MVDKNLFPQYNFETETLKDGILESRFLFCKRNFNSKCKEHYKKIQNKQGFSICPYGFTTYINENENYTSFLVENNIDNKKIKRNTNKKDSKVLNSLEKINILKTYFKEIDSNINAKQHLIRKYDKESGVFSNKKETLDDTLHELRKLNNILKKQAYTLKSELERSNTQGYEINLRSKNILATTQLITARLNAYDFTLNPELSQMLPPSKVSLYKKFDKARQCLEVVTKDLSININFKGESRCRFECSDIVDLLPFILFENAIKFNKENNDINCEFVSKEGVLQQIVVSNKAKLPKNENLSNLKNKHFRGQNTGEIKGSGKGLYIANMICDFNNFNLEIETIQTASNKNNEGVFKAIITTANKELC